MSVTPDSDSRVAQCEREIAAAIEESQKPHTPMEHLGILLWEMDWRAELDRFLQEIRRRDEFQTTRSSA